MKIGFLYIIVIFSLFACTTNSNENNTNKEKKVIKKQKTTIQKTKFGLEVIDAGSIKQYTGKPGQLLLVSDNTELTIEIETLLDSIFGAPIRPYYPPTPYFEIFHRNPEEFQKSFTSFRSIINFKIDEKIPKQEPEFKVYENYYSRTQLYTKIRAHDMQDLNDVLENNIHALFKIYEQQEWMREFRRFPSNERNVNDYLATKFGINLRFPDKFRYESIDDTYAILIFPQRSRPMDLKVGSGTRSAVNFIQSGVMIWQYPYTNQAQFSPENLMQMRDTILKKYARHEMAGVYMGTQDHPAVLPIHETIKIGDVEGYQFRGLYKFTGEAEPSGGRFWSFHFVHPKRNKIVAISGYFDVPPTMSPHLDINQIRAVLYSLKIVD